VLGGAADKRAGKGESMTGKLQGRGKRANGKRIDLVGRSCETPKGKWIEKGDWEERVWKKKGKTIKKGECFEAKIGKKRRFRNLDLLTNQRKSYGKKREKNGLLKGADNGKFREKVFWSDGAEVLMKNGGEDPQKNLEEGGTDRKKKKSRKKKKTGNKRGGNSRRLFSRNC